VTFSGAATIRQIGEHHERLLAAVAGASDLVVDVSEVTSADLAFVQLIEAARRSAERRGIDVRLSAPAQGALRDVLSRGGLLDPAQPPSLEFWTHTAVSQ
jgi:anti-anti-sigma regulatory factor